MAGCSRHGGWIAWAPVVLVIVACGPGPTSQGTEGTTAGDPATTGAPGTSGASPTSSTSGVDTDATSGGVDPGATTTTTSDVVTGATTSGVVTGATGESSASTLDSSGSETDGRPCELLKQTLPLETPQVMLVLDKSGSMADIDTLWDHDADANTPPITRWNSLHQVIAAVVGAHDGALDLGANLFPSTAGKDAYDITACPVNDAVEVPIGAMNGPAIVAGIPQAGDMSLQGATPAAAGVAAALAELAAQPGAPPRAVVLVTDGPANCSADAVTEPARFEVYDDSLHTLVAAAFADAGIVTHVVGIEIADEVTGAVKDGEPDGVNPFSKLEALAVQGGRPKADPKASFHHATDQAGLQAAFDAIVADLLRCVLVLPKEPKSPDHVKVNVGGVKVSRVKDCSGEDGWVYVNPNGPFEQIELCGAACQDLRAAGEAEVEFFCIE